MITQFLAINPEQVGRLLDSAATYLSTPQAAGSICTRVALLHPDSHERPHARLTLWNPQASTQENFSFYGTELDVPGHDPTDGRILAVDDAPRDTASEADLRKAAAAPHALRAMAHVAMVSPLPIEAATADFRAGVDKDGINDFCLNLLAVSEEPVSTYQVKAYFTDGFVTTPSPTMLRVSTEQRTVPGERQIHTVGYMIGNR